MILYTTGCPQCNVLHKKLEAAGIEFDTCEDVAQMRELGFAAAPVLELDSGERLDFSAAIGWLRGVEANG